VVHGDSVAKLLNKIVVDGSFRIVNRRTGLSERLSENAKYAINNDVFEKIKREYINPCAWCVNDGCAVLEWNGMKECNITEGLHYIVDVFLLSLGLTLDGEVSWSGLHEGDAGSLSIDTNGRVCIRPPNMDNPRRLKCISMLVRDFSLSYPDESKIARRSYDDDTGVNFPHLTIKNGAGETTTFVVVNERRIVPGL
jgi:hypothetical protein